MLERSGHDELIGLLDAKFLFKVVSKNDRIPNFTKILEDLWLEVGVGKDVCQLGLEVAQNACEQTPGDVYS